MLLLESFCSDPPVTTARRRRLGHSGVGEPRLLSLLVPPPPPPRPPPALLAAPGAAFAVPVQACS